jgi:hypothetical protein
VTECVVKIFSDVKVIRSKFVGTKNPSTIPSSDFEDLDTPESQFGFSSHRLIPQVTDKLANKNKFR